MEGGGTTSRPRRELETASIEYVVDGVNIIELILLYLIETVQLYIVKITVL